MTVTGESTSKRKRVAVAMSGGIDSSVAAAILVDQGLEVIGLTAHMWQADARYCSLEAVNQARQVACCLGINHYVVNASHVFSRDVIDPFVAEYARGRTPSPCVICNQMVKFGLLLERAAQFDCVDLATGHYARIEQRDGYYHLLRARDHGRDQSYFLHRLSQRQLAHSIFPLADLIKQKDVEAYARERSLPITPRSESRDLCFVPDGKYSRFVESRLPALNKTGQITDKSGRALGKHEGIHRYTVGQRRGLGIASAEPLYVTRLDAQHNVVEVGPHEQTLGPTCCLEDVHWIAGHPPANNRLYNLRIRYRHEGAPAHIRRIEDGRVRVDFLTPQFAITPGQAGVFYDQDEVLGGGWLTVP